VKEKQRRNVRRGLRNNMNNIKRNIYAFHTDPMELVGYDDRDMVPTILLDKIRNIRSNVEMIEEIEQSRAILGKDLDVAIRAAELYKNSESRNLWPVGSEVEMALLRSDKHRDEHLKYNIGTQLQKDPRYLDVLRQLDPVTVAKYVGYLVNQSYHVDLDFKEKVLEIINQDIAAGLAYSARSIRRNYKLEPILLRMSRDKWQDVIRNSPYLSAGQTARYYDTAWEYYLRGLSFQDGRQAVADARADYGYEP